MMQPGHEAFHSKKTVWEGSDIKKLMLYVTTIGTEVKFWEMYRFWHSIVVTYIDNSWEYFMQNKAISIPKYIFLKENVFLSDFEVESKYWGRVYVCNGKSTKSFNFRISQQKKNS